MDCITFLGTGNYQDIVYKYNDLECRTSLFSTACIEFFEPERLYVVMTEEAKVRHYSSIRRGETDIIEVMIPNGESENQIWQIFNNISEVIENDAELVIDIGSSIFFGDF